MAEDDAQESDGAASQDRADAEGIVYLMAYHPEVVALHTDEGTPNLPHDLIPLCRLRYSAEVRPEAVETAQALSRNGVGFKVLSAKASEQTAAILRQAGIGQEGDEGSSLRAISGSQLAKLDGQSQSQAVAETTIFGQAAPEQERQVMDVLRQRGEVVAVAGDGVSDLPAMRQARLSITLQSSSPEAVLAENSHPLRDQPVSSTDPFG